MKFDALDQLQQCVDKLESSDASELNGLLDGVRAQIADQERETQRLGRAQADALVYSADIISELEETKERLEVSRSEAESATKEAKLLSAFGGILDRSLNEIFIFDAQTLHFVHVNHGARENIGYTMEELRAMTPLDIKPTHTPASFAEMVAPLLDGTKENIEFTTIHRRKNGTEYPVQVQLEMSVLGKRPVFAAIMLDITEQRIAEKQLRDSELKSRTLLEGSPVCIKIIDLDSRLQYMSAAGIRQLKIADINPFYGQVYPPASFPESMRAPLSKHLDRAKLGQESSVVSSVLDTDGSELWYHTTFTPARDGDERIEYIIATSVEITTQKRAEADLIDSKEAAEAANRAKSEFLANMSHEIRTPMTAILGFNDILLDNAIEQGDIDAARTIKENGNYLICLINDILDLSKIEAGKIEMEQIECSANEIVAEVVSLMRVRATAKGLPLNVRFDGPIPEKIQSDPTRLRQVLINIVGNAVKFTETGSIEIVARLLDETGEEPKLQIDVIDTGIGIAKGGVEKLFWAFTQADNSTTRQFGGSGLGLTISKRLVEALGGEISVSSTVGKGSTFSITVSTGPLGNVRMVQNSAEAEVENVDIKVASKVESLLTNRHILLVEDGPDNQRLISFVLKKAGAEVTVADNGQIGLELAIAANSEERPFDVILMDIQMPVLDGYSATRQLREDGYTLPIIALTAHAMSSDRQKCLDAGCDAYTTKPIDRAKLIELVAGIAKRADAGIEATPA